MRPAMVITGASVLLLGGGVMAAAFPWRGDPEPRPPDSTLAPASAAPLVLEPSQLDLGRLEVGEGRRVEVAWCRQGPGLLRVLAVHTGCSCVAGAGLPEVVPEGARGALALEVRGRSSPGPFLVIVRILTDRPPDDVVPFRLRGFVGSATTVDPPALHLGAVSPGVTLRRAVAVRPPPPRREAPVEARVVGLAASCDVGPPADRAASGADVRVTLTAPAAAGPFSGHVEVRVQGEGVWRIPLDGVVVGTAREAPR